MRKLNQVVRPRPVPCPIPRPPTPPHSVHVEHLKSQLLNSNKHSLVSSTSSNNSNHVVIMKNNSSSSSPNSSSSSSFTSNNPFKDLKITPSGNESLKQQTIVDVHSLPSDDDGSCNISTSSNSSAESSGSAIEPNEDFPPPPEEFLEDIRAVRKQEEIEGPIPSPTIPNQPILHVFDLTSHHFSQSHVLSQRQRSSLCYNGNGSLNSSITESATESASSWSPSISPVPSPLPSPSHSSLDSASTPNFIIGNNTHQLHHQVHHHSSVPHESAAFPSSPSSSTSSCFQFPPPASSSQLNIRHTSNSRNESNQRVLPSQQIHHLHPRRTSKGIVIALTGVTLAPLSTSCEKESIYQKLPTLRGTPASSGPMYGSLPRSGSGTNTGAGSMKVVKPPDYNTAMQRLSLAKNISSSMNGNSAVKSVSQQQSGMMKQGAVLVGGQKQLAASSPQRQQLIAAVNPQIQVQQQKGDAGKEASSVTHQEVKLNQGSTNLHPTSSHPPSSLATSSSSTQSLHQSFSSERNTDSRYPSGADSLSLLPPPSSSKTAAPSTVLSPDSQSRATQKDNHQNRQEIQSSSSSPPSCLKSPSSSSYSQSSPSHDSNHGSLSQTRRRDLNLPGTTSTTSPAPSPASNISSSGTHTNNCNKLKDSSISPSSKGKKKRVSFSDQVELVGLEEEYLPNPLLERVLGKAFLANNNISN